MKGQSKILECVAGDTHHDGIESNETIPKSRLGGASSTVRGIERALDDMDYRDAFAKAMSMTDAMEADYAGQFAKNSEDRESVERIFTHVRRSEAEFFRHAYSKLRELFDDELAYLKFKDSPTGKPAEKTVVLWDIDESVVYNDARIKKSYVRPAFFPLLELLRTVRPDVRHGVLTSRGDDRLRLQLASHEPHYALTDLAGVFDSQYLFWKESYEGANLGARLGFYVSRDETERTGYETKVRGFHFVNQKEPATRFFLVDDLLQKHFEDLGAGVRLCKMASATVMEALPLPE